MATEKKFGVYASDGGTTVHADVWMYDRHGSASEVRRDRARLKGEMFDALRRVGFNVEQITIKNKKV